MKGDDGANRMTLKVLSGHPPTVCKMTAPPGKRTHLRSDTPHKLLVVGQTGTSGKPVALP